MGQAFKEAQPFPNPPRQLVEKDGQNPPRQLVEKDGQSRSPTRRASSHPFSALRVNFSAQGPV
jgi:hypothetical protein